MNTVGLLTIHNEQQNFGGMLQCFALYEYLRTEGYSVEVINLYRRIHPGYRESIRFMPMRQRIGLRTFIKGWVREIFGTQSFYAPDFKPFWSPVAARKFEKFNSKVKMSEPYCLIPEIYENPPKYDIYIAGSDQIWNPEMPFCIEPYFLTFVKDESARKISYAASMALGDLSLKEKKKFHKWLKSFDYISVRESHAQNILRQLTSKAVVRVPDPTFLIEPEKWINMSVVPDDKDNYILLFFFERNQKIIDKATEIAEFMGCRIKVLDLYNNYDLRLPDDAELVSDAGPLEFIGLIRNARLVLTDSFHCSVFSIITGVQNFYAHVSRETKRGSRIECLLKIYNLESHLVHSMEDLPSLSDISQIRINTKNVRNIIDVEREIGRKFLRDSMNGI